MTGRKVGTFSSPSYFFFCSVMGTMASFRKQKYGSKIIMFMCRLNCHLLLTLVGTIKQNMSGYEN